MAYAGQVSQLAQQDPQPDQSTKRRSPESWQGCRGLWRQFKHYLNDACPHSTVYKAVARLLMTKAQYRLIDGALYKREPRPYCYDFIVHDLGHGQAEALSMPRYAWAEVDATAEAIEQAMMAQTHIRVDGEWVAYTPTRQELLDKAAKNRERSAKRAKTKSPAAGQGEEPRHDADADIPGEHDGSVAWRATSTCS